MRAFPYPLVHSYPSNQGHGLLALQLLRNRAPASARAGLLGGAEKSSLEGVSAATEGDDCSGEEAPDRLRGVLTEPVVRWSRTEGPQTVRRDQTFGDVNPDRGIDPSKGRDA